MKNFFYTKVVEKIKMHFMFNNVLFTNCAIYEILKNIVQPDRPQMTVWCTCTACWIPKAKATNAHSKYVTLIASPLQRWLHKCASLLYNMHIACLV
jgi:hypothetical protein